MKLDASKFTRGEKLTILLNLELEQEQSQFSGHNTAQGELLDLIFRGRKGLVDFTDEELDEQLEFYSEHIEEEVPDADPQKILAFARGISSIDVPDVSDWQYVER